MVSTADGDPLPSSVVERLACGSSWFALVLSSKGVPMWKGRNVRRATDSQFQALLALYGGCAGCGEPDRLKIQAHHMDPFALGGCTDLDNLLPLCWGCHDKVHEHGWQITSRGDGLRTIKPPDRVHHGPARIPEAVPLFAPPDPSQDTDADLSRRSRDRDARAGPVPSRSRAAPAEPAGRSGPRAARAALSAARVDSARPSPSVRHRWVGCVVAEGSGWPLMVGRRRRETGLWGAWRRAWISRLCLGGRSTGWVGRLSPTPSRSRRRSAAP